MYARLTMFTLGPGERAKAAELADAFAPQLRARKGVRSVTFFEDDAAGEYQGASNAAWVRGVRAADRIRGMKASLIAVLGIASP